MSHPLLYLWTIHGGMISYHTCSVSERNIQGSKKGEETVRKMEEMEAFVSTFLTVGIGNGQMLSITSEGRRIDCPIYLMKRSRGGGGGVSGA